jgi:hypothetical protein
MGMSSQYTLFEPSGRTQGCRPVSVRGLKRLRRPNPTLAAFDHVQIAAFLKEEGDTVTESKHFTAEEAKSIGQALDIDWSGFDVEQFRMGLDVELEHGTVDPATDVTHDDPLLTGKIALAHLNEFTDYYTRLARMEEEAKR